MTKKTATIEDALPYSFEFEPARTALIVIDMQRDFIEYGGFGESLGNDVTQLQAIIPNVDKLLSSARQAHLLIIHTRECHRADLSDCPPAKIERGKQPLRIGDEGPMGRLLISDSPGAQIIPQLAPLPGEHVIDKPGKGAFYATQLDALLRQHDIHYLVLSGVTTEVCVQSTMREANDRGYRCLLLEDATESYFPQFKQCTLEMVRSQGALIGWTSRVDAFDQTLLDGI